MQQELNLPKKPEVQTRKSSNGALKIMSILSARTRKLILFLLFGFVIFGLSSQLKLFINYCCSHNTKDGGQNLTARNLSYYMKPEIMKNVQRVKELAHFRSAKRRKSIKNFCKYKQQMAPGDVVGYQKWICLVLCL